MVGDARKSIWMARGAGVLLSLALFFAGCEKPRLRTEVPESTSEAGEKPIAEEPQPSFAEIRKSVIGRKFATLTLRSRTYANAEIRDITDQVIVIGHEGGVDEVPWSEVPDEVRGKWGYDPSVKPLVSRVKSMLGKKDESSSKKTAASKETSAKAPITESKPTKPRSARERVVEIARLEQMVESQRVGIQSLESDLARHTQALNTLRNQLQLSRARQSRSRSGGIIVERVGGKSTVVDGKKEAREIEGKIQVEEQLVTQFSKSLQAARKKYQELALALNRLKGE